MLKRVGELHEKLAHAGAQIEVVAMDMSSDWCALAVATEIPELKTMANTIRTHIEGILTYWRSGGWTSAAVEGFNNKIRWLIKQAYGYRDQKYFDLKIFDLPKTKTVRNL